MLCKGSHAESRTLELADHLELNCVCVDRVDPPGASLNLTSVLPYDTNTG